MAHRGRLNVLAHNLGRAYETIFREFEGASSIEAVTTIPQGGTGDVKYHHGAQGTYQLPDDALGASCGWSPTRATSSTSRPVVEGATRAVQTTRQGPHAHLDNNAAMPIILHGDAAFPGQGVVAETFNLQALDGYTVGGTLHLIQNNQVGFTTDPDDSRSTRWASDLAKGFDVPIIHVNADDVAACISAVRLAFAFRQEFGHDVADRPDRLPPLRPQRGRRAGLHAARDGGQDQGQEAGRASSSPRSWSSDGRDHAGGGRRDRRRRSGTASPSATASSRRSSRTRGAEQPTGGYELDRSPSPEVKTAVSAERLQALNEELLRVPEGFTVHPKLVKQLERRRDGGRPRRRHRLGAGRGARLRVAADRGHAGPPDRPGRRARHVLPAPPRAARRQDRPADLADPVAAGRARADGAAQLAAVARSPASASSTATRWRRRRRSCCGRPSSATSSTRRR